MTADRSRAKPPSVTCPSRPARAMAWRSDDSWAPRPTKTMRGVTPRAASRAAASITTRWPFITRSPETIPTSGRPSSPPSDFARADRPVGARPHAARELEPRPPLHAFLTGAVDHRPLGAAPAAERDCVAAALQLAGDPRRPVGVGRPAAAGDELQDSHARTMPR